MGDDNKLEEVKEPPQAVDRDTARLIRKAGIKVPGVKTVAVQEPDSISKPVYETIAYLCARGLSQTEIARAVKLTKHQIQLLVNSERMKFEIKHLQYKLFGKDHQKAFKEILPYAIDTIGEVIKNQKAKNETRLTAAIYATDRILGKPKQSVEVGGSLIRKIFDRLDGKETIEANPIVKDAEVVEVSEESAPLSNPNETVKPDRETNPNFQPDKWSEWVDKNL